MDHDARYIDLQHPLRTSIPITFYWVNALLKSRIALGLESNAEGFDEDVNVYLVHFLCAYVDPESAEPPSEGINNQPIFFRQTDLHEYLDTHRLGESARAKLWRANADARFLHLVFRRGFFDRCGGRPHRFSREALIGQTRMFYLFTADHYHRLPYPQKGVSEICRKIAIAFDKYLRILDHMRSDHLRLTRRLTDGELFHLQRTSRPGVFPATDKEAWNLYLDAVNGQRDHPSEDHAAQLEQARETLRQRNLLPM